MASVRLTLALALAVGLTVWLAWMVPVPAHAFADRERRDAGHQDIDAEIAVEDSTTLPEEPHHRHHHHHRTQDIFLPRAGHHTRHQKHHEEGDKLKSSPVGSSNGGTQQTNLAKTRPHWNQGIQDVRKANDNYIRILSHAVCKVPRPKVIRVKDIYPDSNSEYLPRCTILHRCGDDVGCCEHDTIRCVAKSSEPVQLYFYALRMITDSSSKDLQFVNTVEKIEFINHTECECRLINDDRPRSGSSGTGHARCPECPTEFSVREYPNDGCSCDCFDRQESCLRHKKGGRTFGETDRRCIESGRCNPPECKYGHYDTYLGRCPKKHERRSSSYQNHWWRVGDRD